MTLPHQPSRVLLQYLLDQGVVVAHSTYASWQGFYNHLPPENGTIVHIDAVVVSDEAGIQEGRYHRTGEVVEFPGFQVRVRSKLEDDGWLKARAISSVMDAALREEVTVSGTNYLIQAINRSTQVIPLGRDPETQRFNHTVNGMITVNQL